MSGHSKWSTIKHRKGAKDAQRGKLFTKLIKEITIAARGGGDPDANPRLRSAIANAKNQRMPKDNIERAIKKGTGELAGEQYEEILYEGYGPHQTALIIEAMTDNRNRTISFVRSTLGKHGGNLGSANSVQYMFDYKGVIRIPCSAIEEDQLLEMALDAGAEDMIQETDEEFQVLTSKSDFQNVRDQLEKKEVQMSYASLSWIPQNLIELNDLQKAESVLKLMDILEDNEDVQNVYSNFEFSESVLETLGK